MKRVFVTMHPRHHYAIHKFCYQANAAQGTVNFAHLLLDESDETVLVLPRMSITDTRENGCLIKKKYGLSEDDLLILVIDGNIFDRFDDEYLVVYDPHEDNPPHSDKGGVAVVSLYFLNPCSTFVRECQAEGLGTNAELERSGISEDLLCLLLFTAAAFRLVNLEEHEDTRGCVMDYCQRPSDVLRATERGMQFCEDCRKKLEKTGDELSMALMAVAERLSVQSRTMSAPRIFISYARSDKEAVLGLYARLKHEGSRPWMDVWDLLPGEKWDLEINRAIRNSDFFMACLSPNSVDRRGSLRHEFNMAYDIFQQMLERDIYLLPVKIQACEVPEIFRSVQWVELFQPEGWEQLLKAIREGVERRRVGT